jgi:hypothetical protein
MGSSWAPKSKKGGDAISPFLFNQIQNKMKNKVLLLSIVVIGIFCIMLLDSCYTQNKAQKQLSKAKGKFPELVAKKNSEWYPCGWLVVDMDSTDYYRLNLDSLNTVIVNHTDTIDRLITDSICSDTCIKYIVKTRTLIKNIQKYIPSKPSVIVKTIKIKDSALISYYEETIKIHKGNSDKYMQKYSKSLNWNIWLLVLLFISVLLNVILYRK